MYVTIRASNHTDWPYDGRQDKTLRPCKAHCDIDLLSGLTVQQQINTNCSRFGLVILEYLELLMNNLFFFLSLVKS